MLLDLAFDVLVPPLSTLVVWNVAGLTYAVVVRFVFGQPVSSAIWIANLGAIGVYVLRGWSLSGTGVRGLVDLGAAPFYVVWKCGCGCVKPKSRAPGCVLRAKPRRDAARALAGC